MKANRLLEKNLKILLSFRSRSLYLTTPLPKGI
jgi:hypothetical protein